MFATRLESLGVDYEVRQALIGTHLQALVEIGERVRARKDDALTIRMIIFQRHNSVPLAAKPSKLVLPGPTKNSAA